MPTHVLMPTHALLACLPLVVPFQTAVPQQPAAAARVSALAAEAAANPYDLGVLRRHAAALREAGDLDASRAAFERVLAVGGERWDDLWNLACVQAVSGLVDEALDTVERSLDAGLLEDDLLLRDPDMAELRELPRFREITGLFPPEGLDRDARWRHDLAFLARRMERMHWDLYAHVSREEWRREIDALSSEVPSLRDADVRARLKRLIARVGDGHTTMRAVPEGASAISRFPLELFLFTDGLYVVGAPRALAGLVGGRVTALGPLSVERALAGMRAYVSVDNEMGYRDAVTAALLSPDVLEALGAVAPEEPLDLELERGGRREREFVERAELAISTFSQYGTLGRQRPPGWVYAYDSAEGELPLWLREPGRALWFADVPGTDLVYCWLGQIDDPPGGTFDGFCRELFEHVEEAGAKRLVLDMRLNGGGNTGVVLSLIHGLVRCDAVNRPGGLFVVTGRRTFSAAMNAASLLELHTAATFVGEPTGSRPNFVGESTSFVLPCTRYRVYCSSRYWQHVVSTDTRPWIAPAIVAEPSFADYAGRRDPVLEAILVRAR